MKQFLATLLCCLVFTSCGTILQGTKKPLVLVDAPKDIVVVNKNTGDTLNVENVQYAGSRSSAQNTATFYYAPGVRFKASRDSHLELTIGDRSVPVKVGKKNMVGILIADIGFSWGLFAIIDFATGGVKRHRPRYVDVPAAFAGTTWRSEQELLNYLGSHSK